MILCFDFSQDSSQVSGPSIWAGSWMGLALGVGGLELNETSETGEQLLVALPLGLA